MKKTIKVKSLRGLFRTPKRWCQGMGARENPDGTTSYCLLGGLSFVYSGDDYSKARKRLEAVVAKRMGQTGTYGGGLIIAFNDGASRTFRSIRSVIREARV